MRAPAGPPHPLEALREAPAGGSTERLLALAIDFGTSSSTVTLFDDIHLDQLAVRPAQLATLGRRLAALLRRPDWPTCDGLSPDELRAELCERAQLLGNEAAGSALPADAAALADRLDADARTHAGLALHRYLDEDTGGNVTRARRLDVVSAAFELLIDDHQELVGWLAPLLHDAHDATFDTTSLASYSLTAVALEGRDELTVPSMLVVPEVGLRRARLRDESDDSDVGEFPGLKRHLARPVAVDAIASMERPKGWAADTDLLIGLAYSDLVRRIEGFGASIAHLAGRSVEQATITYPTTTPSGPRQRLRELLQAALRAEIDIAYDEGVAAALFFVLRELGGSLDSGVESLRARSRPRDRAGTWTRTMLVVDIGGGTTDIALVAIELDEIPLTTPGSAGREAFRGRHYRLRPRVLGTAGHAQLGGDLLTLKVFYWLKAALADALLTNKRGDRPDLATLWSAAQTEDPVPASLATLITGFDQPDPAPRAVRAVLRELLPTHSDAARRGAENFRGNRAFLHLWNAAERAKRTLAGGAQYTMPRESLVPLKNWLAEGGDGDGKPWLNEVAGLTPPVLDPDDFARLARPVLDNAMSLAGALARQRLGGSADAVLDVVALAGRTCGMPVAEQSAREVMTDMLLDGHSTSAVIRWDPAALLVETQYAKQAASIGACWARSNRENRSLGIDTDKLAAGENLVDIEVDDISLTLPCGFDVAGQEANDRTPLLEPGTPLDRTRIDGAAYVASRWLPLRPDLRLHRRLDGPGSPSIQWGRFRYRSEAERRSPRAWIPDEGPSRDIRFCVEMDQELTPRLLLRRGTESHVVVDSPAPQVGVRTALRGYCVGHELTIVPPITVRLATEDTRRRRPLFPVPASAATDGFDHHFHLIEGSHPRPPVRGVVAIAALPLPDPDEQAHGIAGYLFELQTGPTAWIPLLEPIALPLSARPGAAPASYWPTLDVEGVFRIVRGFPPHLPADSLDTMERAPGTVYSTAMDDVLPDRNPLWDPFNGVH